MAHYLPAERRVLLFLEQMSPVVDIVRDKPAAVDPTEEYVAGGSRWYGDNPLTLDTLATGCSELTAATIDQMMLDPQVASSVEMLVESALSDGVEAIPGARDRDPRYAEAQEICEAWQRALKRVNLRSFLTQMLTGALTDGSKIAEVTWQLVDDPDDEDDGRLTLRRLAVKERGVVRYVIDRFWNVLGFSTWFSEPTMGLRKLYPAEKFVWLSLHVHDEDPRGRSSIRAAYTPWYLKSRIPVQYHRFLDQLILPFFIGFTAPGAEKRNELLRAEDGTKTPTSAANVMLEKLKLLKSMFAAVFPADAKVEVHKNDGTGDAFGTAYSVLDRQIVKGVMGQDLATSDSAYNTRAASKTHMSVFDYKVRALKNAPAEMLDELARRFTRYNFGASAAANLSPIHSLGDTERRDWAADLKVICDGWAKGPLKLADIPKLFQIFGIELAEDWEERLEVMMSAPAPAPAADPNFDDEADSEKTASEPEDDEEEPAALRTHRPRAAWRFLRGRAA